MEQQHDGNGFVVWQQCSREMGELRESIAAMEERMNVVEEGVANFRAHSMRAEKFFTAYETTEAAKLKAIQLVEDQRKERAARHLTIAGIVVAAVMAILIALCGWAYTTFVKPIVDDIESHHPAAKIHHNTLAEPEKQVYAQDKKEPEDSAIRSMNP